MVGRLPGLGSVIRELGLRDLQTLTGENSCGRVFCVLKVSGGQYRFTFVKNQVSCCNIGGSKTENCLGVQPQSTGPVSLP